MRRLIIISALILLIAACEIRSSSAESRIIATPAEASAGQIIDLQVIPDEKRDSVTYRLSRNGESVFQGKEDSHFSASFRPRQEGEYLVEAVVRSSDGEEEYAQAEIKVTGRKEEKQGPDTIYSQKDGWWKDSEYSKSDLETSGCAIFALSHAMQRIGFQGDDLEPDVMAGTYQFCYSRYGTVNGRLVESASKVYGYSTKNNLIKSKSVLKENLENGDLFSFGIVNGHIALMTGIDSKENKVRIVDSAPSATFERIKNGKIFYLEEGKYVEALDPGDIPGSRYYFETGFYGGLEYYMDLAYCARRGGRLIRPSWLYAEDELGLCSAELIEIGTAFSTIQLNGEVHTVPTGELKWGAEKRPRIGVVSGNKSIVLYDAEKKRIAGIPACTMVPIIDTEESAALVVYKGQRGYVRLNDIVVLTPTADNVKKGIVAVNGKSKGNVRVKVRVGPSDKHHILDQWKVGTEVTVIDSQDAFYLVEANSRRAWIMKEYVLTGDENGQEIYKGE